MSAQKNKDTYVYRVDLSYVFQRLFALSTPLSLQRGKEQIYLELESILELFHKDKNFMAQISAMKKKK